MGLLFGSEKSVAGVAETGENVAVFVEATVEGRDVDIYVGMSLGNTGNSFGSADDRHKLNMLTASVLEELDSIASTSAGCKHGVDYENYLFLDVNRKLAVVGLGFEGLLIAIHADMSDASRGEENVNSVYHTETCAEDRHDSDGVILYELLFAGLKGSVRAFLVPISAPAEKTTTGGLSISPWRIWKSA